MEVFPTFPSERGSSEWAAFNVVRGDHSDSYPVADIRIRKETKRKPYIIGDFELVLRPH